MVKFPDESNVATLVPLKLKSPMMQNDSLLVVLTLLALILLLLLLLLVLLLVPLLPMLLLLLTPFHLWSWSVGRFSR